MKFIVLSSLLLLVLFAALPAFADEDGNDASGPSFNHPQPPAHHDEKKPHDGDNGKMEDLKHEDNQDGKKMEDLKHEKNDDNKMEDLKHEKNDDNKMKDLKHEDGKTHGKESHGKPNHHKKEHHGDDDHKKHDREHDHKEHHWRRPHVSGWHIFSSIWFFVSVGVLGFFILFGLVFAAAKVCRRRCHAAKAVEGFQPLVETKCPPQLDA